MNEPSTQQKRSDLRFDRISEYGEGSPDYDNNLDIDFEALSKSPLKASKSIKMKSALDYIDLKYVRHTSSYAPRLKHRSFSQQGSERSFKSSEKTLTSSLLKNPFTQSRTSLSTPRFFSSTYDTMVHRDKFQKQPKVVYMNIIGDPAIFPKYLSETVKLEALKKEDCNRNFERTSKDFPEEDSPERVIPFHRNQSFTSPAVKSKATQEKPPEKNITFFGEFNPKKFSDSPRISLSKATNPDFLKIPTTLTMSVSSTGDSLLNNSVNNIISASNDNKNQETLDDYSYAKLENQKNPEDHDYNERIYTMKKNEYKELIPPKLQQDQTNLGYFKIQRTKSYYEMLDAIKKRTKFSPKNESNQPEPAKTETPKIVEFVDFSSNAHNCFEKRKKVDNSRIFLNKLVEAKEEVAPDTSEKRLVVKGFDKLKNRPIVSQINNDSPLLDTYKEIVKKSIDQNIEKIKKSKEKVDEKPVEKKYVHLLDQLLDFERENRNKLKLKLNSKVPRADDDYEPIYYDINLNKSGNWLLRWSVIRNVTTKNLMEIFQKNDTAKKGYLQGESLRTAISMACNMSNLKLSYLYSVLNLCGIDSANLKIFNIITSLALKINYLDDEWFKNLLPQLDLSSVENKVFKALSLWKYLANPRSKTLSIYELLIEFKAGGVSKAHIDYARKKFSDRLYFDITDYLTYIPLFLHIHDRIVKNPFQLQNEI